MIINIAIYSSFAMLLVALTFALFRLVKGPSINDRIAAMDLIASITVGFIIIYSLLVRKALYFDLVIIISLISFIGTVAVSTYLKRKA